MDIELKIYGKIVKYCLRCAPRHEGDVHGGKIR